jgi:hypothetical protein
LKLELSPKVIVPAVISIACSIVLMLLTGDKTFLIGVLVSLAGGAAGYGVEPAPRVTQSEINRLSRERMPKLGCRDH